MLLASLADRVARIVEQSKIPRPQQEYLAEWLHTGQRVIVAADSAVAVADGGSIEKAASSSDSCVGCASSEGEEMWIKGT